MDANAVVLDLLHYKIIDSGDEARLSRTYDRRQQNQILHLCLKQKCTREAFKIVCSVIIKVEGNPKMRVLGEDMRRLVAGVCLYVCVCTCVCVYILVRCYSSPN